MGIIYSSWGKQSGAHINPSITLTFWRLGKVEPWDAVFYVVAQFAGGLFGVGLVAVLVGHLFTGPPINYAATMPGASGPAIAFLVELVVSFGLMVVVLAATNAQNIARLTGFFAGIFIASAFSLAAPLSGMSINPARTFASALPARLWTAFWVYFTAPPLGMLVAAEVYLRLKGPEEVICAKLHHHNNKRCIFICGYKRSGGSNNKGKPSLRAAISMVRDWRSLPRTNQARRIISGRPR